MTKEQFSTENITTNIVSPDGKTRYERIIHIKTYWNNMNPYIKKGIILYSIISIICYGIYNYQDGKRALLDIRNKTPNCSTSDEWKAIKNGINSCNNFFSAILFPYSITSKIMPTIILGLNPKPKINPKINPI